MLQPSATVELIWQDETGSRATSTLWAPSGLAVSVIEADALAFASIVEPLSGCSLVGIRIKYRTAFEPGIMADGPNPTTRAGVFLFTDDSGDVNGIATVPGIADDVLATDGPGAGILIDVTNESVSDFVTAVLDAGLCNPFAVPFVDLRIAYRQSRV